MFGFWFNMRRFTLENPRAQIAELKRMANATPNYHTYRDMFGKGRDIGFGEGEAVDLAGEPHFYTVPPATMRRGIPS